MFETSAASVSLMMYREAGEGEAALGLSVTDCDNQPLPAIQGLTEDEVTQRVEHAVECARAEARARYYEELQQHEEARSAKLAEALLEFGKQQTSYFERVEGEVVRLALSISRKILEREARVDPSLLGALVRIALERMQSGPSVRIRVTPGKGDHWRAMSSESESSARWEVVEDPTLSAGDCVVETEAGSANYGFDAQLSGVEEIFTSLLAKRPHP